MRKTWTFLVSALAVVAFVITPTSAGAAGNPEGLWPNDYQALPTDCEGDPRDMNGFCIEDDDATFFGSVELGVRFATSTDVDVTGVRVYRVDVGPVTGTLWDESGSVLATGQFSDYASQGWQDLTFDTPVAITPGNTYTASILAPNADYAYGDFSNDITVGPITALGSYNGVYCYEIDPFGPCVFPFPTNSSGYNYWVTPLWVVPYDFEGFFSPVDNDAVNLAKAGQSIPLKFRVTGADGVPITDLTTPPVTVSSTGAACERGVASDAVETYAGGSGLQNLGDGYYQFNWKTPKSYKGHCRTMTLSLGDGNTEHTAEFQFQ